LAWYLSPYPVALPAGERVACLKA
jgi:hypothetical protein